MCGALLSRLAPLFSAPRNVTWLFEPAATDCVGFQLVPVHPWLPAGGRLRHQCVHAPQHAWPAGLSSAPAAASCLPAAVREKERTDAYTRGCGLREPVARVARWADPSSHRQLLVAEQAAEPVFAIIVTPSPASAQRAAPCALTGDHERLAEGAPAAARTDGGRPAAGAGRCLPAWPRQAPGCTPRLVFVLA